MYIMYIDESGDTTPLSQGGKKFLTLSNPPLRWDYVLIK